MKLSILLLFFIFAYAKSDLKCYDCDPTTEGNCVTPRQDNVKAVVCSESLAATSGVKKEISDIDKLDIEPRINANEKEYECFSLYFETATDGLYTGVYRGCEEKPRDLRSTCEYLKERLVDGNVTTCQSCSESICNTHDVGSASTIFAASLGIVAVNLIVCLRVLNF